MIAQPTRLAVAALGLCVSLAACTIPGGAKSLGSSASPVESLPAASEPASPTTLATPTASGSPTVLAPSPSASTMAGLPGSPASTGTGVPGTTPTSTTGLPVTPSSGLPTASATLSGWPTPSSSIVTPSSQATPGGATPHGAAITVPAGTSRSLGWADATAATGWVQGGFQPVGSAYYIESLSSQAGCNTAPAPLQFQFAGTAGTLTLGVAQAADSPSSNERLTWTVAVNGQQAQTTSIGFRDAAELTVPLSGASTVQVQLSNPGPCTGSASGLITKAVVTA